MSVKNALPIYVQISEMLIRDVSAGHYLDGARLPPERQLATDLGEIGRASCRERV